MSTGYSSKLKGVRSLSMAVIVMITLRETLNAAFIYSCGWAIGSAI